MRKIPSKRTIQGKDYTLEPFKLPLRLIVQHIVQRAMRRGPWTMPVSAEI